MTRGQWTGDLRHLADVHRRAVDDQLADELVAEAEARWLTDAVFHARVHRAVLALDRNYRRANPHRADRIPELRAAWRMGAAVALLVADAEQAHIAEQLRQGTRPLDPGELLARHGADLRADLERARQLAEWAPPRLPLHLDPPEVDR